MQHNDYVDLLPLKEGYTTVIAYTKDVVRCCVHNITNLHILVVYTTLPLFFQAYYLMFTYYITKCFKMT